MHHYFFRNSATIAHLRTPPPSCGLKMDWDPCGLVFGRDMHALEGPRPQNEPAWNWKGKRHISR
eukprot:161049-Amphidinium_carterae.1